MNRADLIKKENDIQNQLQDVRKQIEEFDHDENLIKVMDYKGKYFSDIEYEDCISYTYVYDIDTKTCEPLTIEIYNYGDSFGFRSDSQFNPQKWGDEYKFAEISKEEFDIEYNKILTMLKERHETKI